MKLRSQPGQLWSVRECGKYQISWCRAPGHHTAQHNRPTQNWHACNITLPLDQVDVWHHIKFSNLSLQLSSAANWDDAAHAEPKHMGNHNKLLPAHFDTVLVHDQEGEPIGIQGKALVGFRQQPLLTSRARITCGTSVHYIQDPRAYI
jgi:hypothetical protein